MRAVLGIELPAVRQLAYQALEPLAVDLLARLIEYADAPDHFFQALELIVQHAEGSGRALLRAAHQIAFEEQLLRGLRMDVTGQAKACRHKCECKRQAGLHGRPFPSSPPSAPSPVSPFTLPSYPPH